MRLEGPRNRKELGNIRYGRYLDEVQWGGTGGEGLVLRTRAENLLSSFNATKY